MLFSTLVYACNLYWRGLLTLQSLANTTERVEGEKIGNQRRLILLSSATHGRPPHYVHSPARLTAMAPYTEIGNKTTKGTERHRQQWL